MTSNAARLAVHVGDITALSVDAIVNAANEGLRGGGGVDGAVHAAAGPELMAACRLLGGCPTGEARMTEGYALAATYIIHTVGPIWQGGAHGEDTMLRSCYTASLEIASAKAFQTIAFPAISTGVYRFPPERAATIAVDAVLHHLAANPYPERLIFCCFSDRSAAYHRDAIAAVNGPA